MIKVLAISHAYVEPYTRIGLVDTESFNAIDTTIIIPRSTKEACPDGYAQLSKEFKNVVALNAYLNFHHSVRFYGPGLISLLKQNNPDILFINNEPWSTTAFQTVLLCSLLGLKAKIIVYTSENQERIYPWLFRFFERYVLRKADLVLTVTQREGERVLRHKGYRGAVDYVPLAVDSNVFKKIDALDLRKAIIPETDVFLFGYIGRLVEEKGIQLIVQALRNLDRRMHLLIIGGGPFAETLRNLISEYHLNGRVHFINGVFNTQLPRYLNCLNALVLPSLTTHNWKEQFGRVLVEAMACEIPVIGSSSGEIPVVIGNGGLIFSEGSVDDLKKNMLALAENKILSEELGKSGRKRVEENFSRAVVSQKTFDFFRRVLNESSC